MRFNIDLSHYLAAHSAAIYAVERQNHQVFYTGGEDGNILMWDLNKPGEARAIAKTQASVYVLQLIKPHLLFVGTNNGECYLLNTQSKKVVAEQNFGGTVFAVQYLEETQELLIALADGYVARASSSTLTVLSKALVANGHIRAMARIPSTDQFVLGSSDGCLYRINTDLKVLASQESAHKDSVFSLHFLNKTQLISGGKDAYLKQWNLDATTFIEENGVPAHMFTVNDIIAGPGEGEITTASRDKSIKVWEASTLLLKKVIDRSKTARASSHSVNRLTYLSLNQLIAVGDDRIVRIYKMSPL